jgi:hypothetical protein
VSPIEGRISELGESWVFGFWSMSSPEECAGARFPRDFNLAKRFALEHFG